MQPRKKANNALKAMLISPIIVVGFVLTGMFLGFYFGSSSTLGGTLLAIILSTVGLFASIPVIFKLVTWLVKQENKSDSVKG
jgi:lipopolysaccharide export LptBFGC system permease protein LptF